jgi:hypothetical protein
MADAIIFATARQESVPVATCDEHFSGLPGVSMVSTERRKQAHLHASIIKVAKKKVPPGFPGGTET